MGVAQKHIYNVQKNPQNTKGSVLQGNVDI